MKPNRSPLTQTVTRAVAILDLFTETTPEWSPPEMAKHLGLNQSTTHRLITTMEALGYLERSPRTSRYRLGLRLIQQGHLALHQQELFRQTWPVIQEFSRLADTMVTLAILYQGKTLYLSRSDPPSRSTGGPQVGRVVPAHCTAIGQVLLSHLTEAEVQSILSEHGLPAFTGRTVTDPEVLTAQLAIVREQGYAVVMSEWIDNNGGVAAPVRDSSGKVMAAVALSGPEEFFDAETLPQMISKVRDCATRLSYLLGYILAYA